MSLRRSITLAIAAAGAAAAAGCAPNPIIARDPIPPPTPDQAYRCLSTPLLFNYYATGCDPAVAAPRTVVRAKG